MSKKIIFQNQNLTIKRDSHGIPHVQGTNIEDLYWGFGYCHAMDRGLSMLLTKILGYGRASEFLDSSDATLEVDVFFRKMNWQDGLEKELEKINDDTKKIASAYCEGVNFYFGKKYPWELKLLGYKVEKWIIQDIFLLSKMIGFVSLAQSQGEIEKLFLEMVQGNIEKNKLEELFPGLLGELDEKLIHKISLFHSILPKKINWKQIFPPLTGSNNWVLSGKKTTSKFPILSNDPHLEINRLPNVWYEIVLKCDDNYLMGASIPGIPGILIGRNKNLSWGATYTFLDGLDSWVEECKDGKFLYEGEWKSFQKREETILRKKKKSHQVTFYENHHGLLEGDPRKEGHYLATKWATSISGGKSLEVMFQTWKTQTVKDGMKNMGHLETSWNWVFADLGGNIGYQMSGLMPKRRDGANGFLPLPGWKKENDWQGFVSVEDLPSLINPEKGYIITANQNLNHLGNVQPINVYQGEYRFMRIQELIEEKDTFSLEEMKHIQYDLYSIQARKMMEIWKPLLPNTLQGNLLKNWDCQYDGESKGAYLFEKIYQIFLQEIFGKNGMGEEMVEYLLTNSGIFPDFFWNFDQILLSSSSLWFGNKKRDDLYQAILKKALPIPLKPWKNAQKITFNHILLGGKLPKFLGFDLGPFHLPGGRATPNQGQIYQSGGRTSSFAPSFRFFTDLGEDVLYSNIAGGPSDRRFSKWYSSDLKNWFQGKFKKVTPFEK